MSKWCPYPALTRTNAVRFANKSLCFLDIGAAAGNTNTMEIQVVAATHSSIYLAVDSDSRFYVLTLDDTRPIECEDILRGRFDGNGSLFYSVRNVTSGHAVRICLENWDCPLELAIEMILNFLSANPGFIKVGKKTFGSNTPALKQQLAHEIRNSVGCGH